MRALALIPALSAALLLTSAASGAPEHHAAGRKLAQKCAPCHAIGAKDSVKGKAATPFRALAQKYPLDSLQEALAEGIIAGHDDTMPVFKMNPAQIEAFLAYLAAIQR